MGVGTVRVTETPGRDGSDVRLLLVEDERPLAEAGAVLRDLLDRKLTGKVVLPKQTRVIGFGAGGTVYTIRVDEDDLQYLQRYRG